MKKFIFLLFLPFLLFFNIPFVHASTLYSNNFTTNFFNTLFGVCTTSSSGVTCNSAVGINTTQFPTVACISGNFDSSAGNPQLVFDQDPTAVANVITANFNNNSDIVVNVLNNFTDTGVPTPTGAHNYKFCQGTNQLTVYIDNSLAYTLNTSFTHPNYIGFTLSSGSTLTNYLATDGSSATLYSNNFTTNFFNTFFGACTTSSSGVTCNSAVGINTTQFPTVACISGNFDSSAGNPQLVFDQDPTDLANVITANFNSGSNIIINVLGSTTDTGVPTPTGAHNYGFCQGTNQLTVYIDNSLAYTLNTSFTHLNYIGFTLSSGTTLTNYLATDTLPVNAPPSVGTITVATSPVQVNTAITASANFTDPNTSATHTASWNWGDGNTTTGTVTESNGSGSVSDTHTYSATGVYTVTLTVTNNSGASGTQTYQYVSVYNPTPQGLFSGAHKFSSPAGAYPQNSSLTGDVTFGLSYKYSGTMPVGDKQFVMNFKAANLLFNATSISSLVIANSQATLTGTGTINGSGSYNFLVTGVDSGGIRVQITDPANNNNVIYDTQPGTAATATPTTSVNGHVIVH